MASRTTSVLLAVPLLLAAAACGGGDVPTEGLGAVPSAMTAQSQASDDGLVLVTMTSSGPEIEGQDDTFTWTATNVSSVTISGVELGSNWADHIGQGPTLVSAAPGCGGQSPSEFPLTANMGVWCTPNGGVTLAPGASVSGSVTIRPLAGGPARYNTYALFDDPLLGGRQNLTALVRDTQPVAPAPIDVQISGAASTGSPAAGTSYTYTYQVKNNGRWASVGGITFSDTLPSSVVVLGVSATLPFGSSCTTAGQTVTCPLADLLNGASATVAITVRAPSTPQQIVNAASVTLSSSQTDTQPANDSVTITVVSR